MGSWDSAARRFYEFHHGAVTLPGEPWTDQYGQVHLPDE